VQLDPIKPTLKASSSERLRLKSDEPLSNVAFKFNLRRYHVGRVTIIMNDYPYIKYAVIGLLGLLVVTSRE
jgi:hypothetical protein